MRSTFSMLTVGPADPLARIIIFIIRIAIDLVSVFIVQAGQASRCFLVIA